MSNRTNWILAAITLVLGLITWQQGGLTLVLAGLEEGLMTLISVIPLLIAAFLIAGLAQVLITAEFINRWLSSASGWRGIALACIGGALLPGGPYVYYPITAVMLKAGAGLGVMVSFIAAKNLYAVARIPLEIALLGPRLTLMRIAVTLVMPPLLGFLAETLFGRYIDRIRAGVA